jgi:hypothetical protein
MNVNYVPISFGFLIISMVLVLGITPTRGESTELISSGVKSTDDSKKNLIPAAIEGSIPISEDAVVSASQPLSPILLKMKAGLLLLHRENNDKLALVTDSFSPGGTNIVNAKDLDLKLEHGLDASLRAMLHTLGTTLGAEVRYFGINEWSESHGPVLLPANNLVVMKHQPPVAILSTGETTVLAKYKSGLHNAELNLSWYPKENIRVFIGARYIRLDEDLRISHETFGTTVLDKVSTKNDLLGGQVGIEGVFFGKPDGGFSIDGWAKGGYFNNDGLVKSRHSRENGNPEEFQVPKKTGFLLAQE